MTVQSQEWTLKRLLEWTTDYLTKANIDQPRLCAEILLAHTLQCQRIELYTNFNRVPNPDQLTQYRQLVRRCYEHEPAAYLVGQAHFYSLSFTVGPGVLVPRPETEVLVTEALTFIRQTTRPTIDVLDLCTGSACVAVAIAVNCVEAEVLAVDISENALEYAQQNVTRHELQPRVTLMQSDLFSSVEQSGKGVFDLIVSNPPYIAQAVYEQLDRNVKDYEPPEALLAGPEGLDFYRRILNQADSFLADNAMLMVEGAFDQADDIAQLFQQTDYLTDIQTVRDQLGHKRVVKARKI
ncbi:MAG: peptide chain release factor N(5)-glutamine methyltransferase [Sedimentisphaerales bacterium]|nr:peptide chain release factor N(5)-glutamine methyltransferase [Sedimentisphaerales bacterium]